jgi:hypothetical protein
MDEVSCLAVQAAAILSAITAERVTVSNVLNLMSPASKCRLPNHPRDLRSPDSIHGVHGKVIEFVEMDGFDFPGDGEVR